MKTIVTGSSMFANYLAVDRALRSMPWTITEVLSDGSRGASDLGVEWARENRVNLTVVFADYGTLGRHASRLRDEDLLGQAEAGVVLPGKDLPPPIVDLAKNRGMKVIFCDEEGHRLIDK